MKDAALKGAATEPSSNQVITRILKGALYGSRLMD